MASKKRFSGRNILWALLAVLLLLQFFRIDKTNPPVEASKDFLNIHQATPLIQRLIKDGCYDCHSHEVEYPWYTNVAPVSFWIAGHIRNARKNTNFSTWGDYPSSKQKHKLEECIEVLEENRMPPASFKRMHPEANMSDVEKAELLAWLRSL